MAMKVQFLRDVTVEVMEPNDIYEKLIRQGTIIEVENVVPLSKNFSTFHFDNGVCWVDIKNDLFRKVVS
jgi:hypothetical protein